ncbi:MAG TPA: DUF2271 domain-containing protein [Candidatus Cloacimonadota bacterium]|nr:DUF2271 domain-containing protein [Candidatus Cloacimonadota bacterium]
MKKVLIILLGICSLLLADTIDETIIKADQTASTGNLKEAVQLIENALKENPDSADLLAKYGFYLSQLAGQASMMEAGMLSEKAFQQFDKALALHPGHLNATLNRGILAVQVPKFMGKLKQGIKDLESIRSQYGSNPALYATSTYYLGIGYQKNEENQKAAESFNFIILYAKDSQFYEDARERYEELAGEKKEDTQTDHLELGMKYLEENQLQPAVEHLRLAAKQQPENLELYMYYAQALGGLANQGYDDSISEDVTNLAALAHEVHEVLSHCVELAPQDEEIRFLRGSVAVGLPFFVNSLETGIQDLEFLSQNAESAEIRSKADYLLQQANDRKKVYELAELGYLAESDEEKKQLLDQFISTQSPIEQKEPAGEHLTVELTIGYRDQIAPQTAVWLEDEAGNYLATLYISGFAACIKEKQVHLPGWAESSQFQNIELVTGASIDCGKHTFYWDFTDVSGKKFNGKNFVLKTEICHWPHVQYTQQALPIDLSRKTRFHSKGDNYLLPQISASFMSDK